MKQYVNSLKTILNVTFTNGWCYSTSWISERHVSESKSVCVVMKGERTTHVELWLNVSTIWFKTVPQSAFFPPKANYYLNNAVLQTFASYILNGSSNYWTRVYKVAHLIKSFLCGYFLYFETKTHTNIFNKQTSTLWVY